MKQPILTLSDPRLRQFATAVTAFDQALCQLVRDLLDTLKHAEGLGLAAPQIGANQQVFVVRRVPEAGVEGLLAINPRLEPHGPLEPGLEGCLSIPGRLVAVPRFARVTLRAQDIRGNVFERELEGLTARVVQHETDHLYGILIIDHAARRRPEAPAPS